ncbi:hypothetical protein F5Y01DRAFT_173147 [Xylaria sp. FL0043]|nr:hypothetical protein F5Y01DRAFT_173147 [Xylaria sp. FL0043]
MPRRGRRLFPHRCISAFFFFCGRFWRVLSTCVFLSAFTAACCPHYLRTYQLSSYFFTLFYSGLLLLHLAGIRHNYTCTYQSPLKTRSKLFYIFSTPVTTDISPS